MKDCHECGEPFEIDESGVADHVDEDGLVDHDADADHVPFSLEDEAGGEDG